MSTNELDLKVRTRTVGPWPMNTYALVCPTTRQSVLIDPGAEPDTLMEMLADTQPIAILLTHTHPDHIGALDEMRTRLAVPLMAHGGPHVGGLALDADRELSHGDEVRVGDCIARVYYTPGHTEDMICVATASHRHIVVGDTIFAGGPGRTWSGDGFRTTLATLRDIVLQWPDEARCYPGHGPDFVLGTLRAEIEAFAAKDHGDFFGDASWDM